jgi:hypothetical protein
MVPGKGCSYIIRNHLRDEIGHISYTGFHLLPGTAELDIWLSKKEFTGHGFSSKAIGILEAELLSGGYSTLNYEAFKNKLFCHNSLSESWL